MTEPLPSHRGTAALTARYTAPLMSFFLRRVGDRSDAEELTQEVFMRLSRQYGAEAIDMPDGLIFTIAANLLKDRQRRSLTRRTSAHVSLEAEEGLASEAELLETLDPERILLGKERLASVLSALDDMPSLTRDIFLLYRLEGVKQREIAEVFGISISTVEKHLGRALKNLARNARLS